jgi:hypothetical protein
VINVLHLRRYSKYGSTIYNVSSYWQGEIARGVYTPQSFVDMLNQGIQDSTLPIDKSVHYELVTSEDDVQLNLWEKHGVNFA